MPIIETNNPVLLGFKGLHLYHAHISNCSALWLRERDHYVTVALAAASVLMESMLATSRQESIKRPP